MTGRVGQNGRSLTATAVFAAGCLLAAVVVSACGTSPASASTTLLSARAATVELAGGSLRAAVAGMTVPRGATVVTAPGGAATLLSSDRAVLLGSDTAVTVRDGVREVLRRGLVMVDARRSVGLTLAAGAATVQAGPGSLARVERGVLLRAAAFRGAVTVTATGRRGAAAVPGLHQVQVPDGGEPGRVTPLALTRDSWERRYALDLVSADVDLVALADGLDRDPVSSSAVVAAVPAGYLPSGVRPPDEAPSESALAFALARAVPGAPRDREPVFRTVRALRADGGSWGVVAALVGADVSAVSGALDVALPGSASPAGAAPVGGALAAAGPVSAGPAGAAPAHGGPAPGASRSAGPAPARSAGSPSARPSARPSPSASPDPVAQVVSTVIHALPSPTPPPVPPAPAPSPSPIVSLRLAGVGVAVG